MPAVMRPSPPIGALPVVAQTTPNKVKQKTNVHGHQSCIFKEGFA